MKKRYLPLYEKWLEAGELPADGLCSSLPHGSLNLFDDHGNMNYWGYWAELSDEVIFAHECKSNREYRKCLRGFTPLRQNIVLLLAALNGEL